jgi:hypothetical protein
MIQEIITYLLIGAAIALAINKTYIKFKRKKKAKKIDFKKESFSVQHDCSSCAAECMLRDAAKPIIQNDSELCKRVEIKSDKL